MPQYQQKTKFPGVYSDKDGKYFLQTEFSRDRVTGKRVRNLGKINMGTHLNRPQMLIKN